MSDPFQKDDALPQEEFESLAQQVPVPWTWRTLGTLREQALAAADGIASDTVKDKGGQRLVMVACVTNPEQVIRMEKVLGVATETDSSREWEKTTLFEMALRTALQGGFSYENAHVEAGRRTAIIFCAAGQKGMRVAESLLPQTGAANAQGSQNQATIDDSARAEAGEIIARLSLPEDVRGRTINFVAFANDADCAYFHPGRTREQHEQIFAVVRAQLFSRGVQFSRTMLTPAMFLEAGRYAGDPARWAERRTFLVPSARGSKAYVGQLADGPEAVG